MISKRFPIKRLEQKAKTKLDGRKTIVVIFLLTILASGLVYFKAQLPNLWQQLGSPLVISTRSEEKKFDPTPVLAEIKNLTGNLRGTYGVYVYQLAKDREYGFNHQKVFPAASLMKLPVILTFYQQVEAGKLSLETKYTLKEADKRAGAGILQAKTAGGVYTYRQLVEYMGQYSDNTANNVLVQILGEERIQQTINALGLEKTSLKEYETTPEDMGLFFRKLYQGQLVTKERRQEFFNFLTDTAFEDRIPAGVPEGIRVVHKIGTEIGNFSDAGIVFSQKPFVLVVITKEARESEALEVIPQITEKVWGFEISN